MRAALVILLIITPSTMLPTVGAESTQIVALVAIFAAVFTFVEYSASSPSLVEFRDAPPFNRMRFCALFATVLCLSVIFQAPERLSTFAFAAQVIGERIGASMDFPYSPVRLILLMMPADTPLSVINNLRTAAGLSYLISLLSLAGFVVMLRLHSWPKRTAAFNVWVNLPTFDPTAGGDVVERLNRDAQVNLVLGFLLPFMIPASIKLAAYLVGPISLDDPQTLIWTIATWAFLPASLLMRGVALSRVAQMIHIQRKRAYAQAAADGLLPV